MDHLCFGDKNIRKERIIYLVSHSQWRASKQIQISQFDITFLTTRHSVEATEVYYPLIPPLNYE